MVWLVLIKVMLMIDPNKSNVVPIIFCHVKICDYDCENCCALVLLDIFKFNAEKSVGLYTIDARLSFKIRLRWGTTKRLHYKLPKIDCPLMVPLSSDGNPASGFQITRCNIVYLFTDPDAWELKIETNLVLRECVALNT